jgi:hypothetical protein
MIFMSNADLEFLEEGEEGNNTLLKQKPRPNRHVFRSEGTFLVDEKLSSETESLTMDSGGSSRVSVTTSASNTNTRSQS